MATARIIDDWRLYASGWRAAFRAFWMARSKKHGAGRSSIEHAMQMAAWYRFIVDGQYRTPQRNPWWLRGLLTCTYCDGPYLGPVDPHCNDRICASCIDKEQKWHDNYNAWLEAMTPEEREAHERGLGSTTFTHQGMS